MYMAHRTSQQPLPIYPPSGVLRLNQIPIGITYFDAMRMIHTEVHQKFPQYSNFVLTQRDKQQLQETNQQQHGVLKSLGPYAYVVFFLQLSIVR